MSGLTPTVGAEGLLAAFDAAGVLEPADVHVARRLGRLGGEDDESVLLAVALCVRALRAGSVVLRLSEAPATVEAADPLPWPEPAGWPAALAASPLASGPGAPLHVADGGVWLTRSWLQEGRVAAQLLRRRGISPPTRQEALAAALVRVFPTAGPDEQRRAAALCAVSAVSVLGGGPGTGKTTTIAGLLAVLHEVEGPGLRVALAAPTGKAATRLQQAVQTAELPADHDWLIGLRAGTLHRLLGLRRRGTLARHHAGAPLPYDLVVVDEASMLSLSLFDRLLDALAPSGRLVLVGDPDQLAAVEAGAVLGDLVAAAAVAGATGGGFSALTFPAVRELLPGLVPQDPPHLPGDDSGVALLHRVHRYDGSIAALAQALREGDRAAAEQVLAGGGEVELLEAADGEPVAAAVQDRLRHTVLDHTRVLIGASPEAALAALDGHRLLCAHRTGPRGVAVWSQLVQRWVAQAGVAMRWDGTYVGLPLLVTVNDYDQGLYNGDTGVVVEQDGVLQAAFESPGGIRLLGLGRLGDVRPMHAVTVHRAQGSQFDHVTVVLPEAGSPLATREMLYTAVTRARSRVTLIGSTQALAACVQRRSARATGLRERLAGPAEPGGAPAPTPLASTR